MIDTIGNGINHQIATVTSAQADHALQTAKDAKSAKNIDQAALDFESVFLSQMLTHMFAGVETDPLFGGGQAEKIYKSMMVDEYGKIIAQNGGVGVGDALKKQLLDLQAQQG